MISTLAAITLAFSGDMLVLPTYPFNDVAPTLCSADIAVGNLETAVTSRGVPEEKQFTFRGNPADLIHLKSACFGVVSVANNHSFDYGRIGFSDTLAHLAAAGIASVGGGKDAAEAFSPYIREIEGRRVAIMGLSRVLPKTGWFAGPGKPGIANAYHNEPMTAYVKKAVAASDITVVVIHWDKELAEYPQKATRALAKRLVDLGVDLIIGHHSHTLMGVEFYKGVPIFYSLGNFVFNASRPRTADTMVVKITYGDKRSIRVRPFRIKGREPLKTNPREVYKTLNRLSPNAHIDDEGFVHEVVSR